MNAIRIVLLATLLLAGAAFTGCSSYVNIPPAPGDVARANPNADTVRTVQSVALGTIARRNAAVSGYVVELPAGSTPRTYQVVIDGLPGQAVPAVQPSSQAVGDAETVEGEVASDPLPVAMDMPEVRYTVRSVRVRGVDAEADVAVTGPAGIPQVYTVYMEYAPFSGWSTSRTRLWGTIGDPSMEADKPQPDRPDVW